MSGKIVVVEESEYQMISPPFSVVTCISDKLGLSTEQNVCVALPTGVSVLYTETVTTALSDSSQVLPISCALT